MKHRALRGVSIAVGVVLFLGFTLFPVYWALVSSLESGNALYSLDLWPANPVLDNYVAVLRDQPFGRNIVNSLLVATLTVALSLTLAVFAGYALGRVSFRGRFLVLATILGITMFPQVSVLSGMFELISALGLYDNLLGLALSYLIFTLPFTVWVLTTFMRELPAELEQAALMDGAGPVTIVLRILLPLLWPGLVTAGLLAFIAAWNEFLFALTFTITNSARTAPVAIALISGASQYELPWGQIMAASVLVTVPVLTLTILFQRRIVSGLTAGAVKS